MLINLTKNFDNGRTLPNKSYKCMYMWHTAALDKFLAVGVELFYGQNHPITNLKNLQGPFISQIRTSVKLTRNL